jgi:hypothetical protein
VQLGHAGSPVVLTEPARPTLLGCCLSPWMAAEAGRWTP